MLREQRLVISKSHQQKMLGRKFLRETLLELRIVTQAHFLAAQIFIDLGRVSRVHPSAKRSGRWR